MQRILSAILLIALATPLACAAPQTVAPAAPEVSASPTQSPIAQAPSPIATGSFVSGEHPTQGSVRLIEENGQQWIELGEDFTTNQGPDLYVVLHQSPDVIGSTAPPAYSLNEGEYVAIAPLQSINGSQRYAIPASVDVAAYQSVAIWCREFNATFAAARLDR